MKENPKLFQINLRSYELCWKCKNTDENCEQCKGTGYINSFDYFETTEEYMEWIIKQYQEQKQEQTKSQLPKPKELKTTRKFESDGK